MDILNKPVTYEEIKETVFSIPNDKSPGPDGYTSSFFNDAWEVIGQEVSAAITEFFQTGQLLTQINATNVTLILKCERPTSVKHFRPIACCNMLYKGMNFHGHFIQMFMVCIKTTSFTLSLNGSNFGYFKGQTGLRQGDPITPLIYTMYMEYLTRIIKFATEMWPFQYHPLCKSLKLTHLMFADDLLMFCKGNAASIMLLMWAFSSFSRASGHSMNNSKSEIFFNGMVEELKQDIKQVTGFSEGCWASMFIIPKSVIKRVESICRNFLWDGSSEYHRVPLVAWDKVTLPKAEGGLALRRLNHGTLLLWLNRWINQIYIKTQVWHTYKPPASSSWSWKSICKVKEKIKDGYTNGTWNSHSQGYTVKRGYEWLRPSQTVQPWAKLVWNNWNIPKHTLILWINLNGGLNVKDKLHKLGCCDDDLCCMCSSMAETSEHLFLACTYSCRIRELIGRWIGRSMPSVNEMIASHRDNRNNARIHGKLLRPEQVVKQIADEAQRRIKYKAGTDLNQFALVWLRSIGM
ncbi:uncharacterized protein LOC141657433 [Silene latifolia]|uniref:uncharacterized protein LOC141657433 n=1 Tax=Silene latifolia TaxID=37657 RepID=UPI003D76FC3F